MTQDQFVRSLAEAEGISIKQAREEVSHVLGHIVTAVGELKDGEKLTFTGVVQFEVSEVPARTRRNPQTGEEVALEASRKVKARPMATLKSAVK